MYQHICKLSKQPDVFLNTFWSKKIKCWKINMRNYSSDTYVHVDSKMISLNITSYNSFFFFRYSSLKTFFLLNLANFANFHKWTTPDQNYIDWILYIILSFVLHLFFLKINNIPSNFVNFISIIVPAFIIFNPSKSPIIPNHIWHNINNK